MQPGGAIVPGGDLGARLRLRLQGLGADAALARRLLQTLPDGETWAALPHDGTEGLGAADGPQGTVWHWCAWPAAS